MDAADIHEYVAPSAPPVVTIWMKDRPSPASASEMSESLRSLPSTFSNNAFITVLINNEDTIGINVNIGKPTNNPQIEAKEDIDINLDDDLIQSNMPQAEQLEIIDDTPLTSINIPQETTPIKNNTNNNQNQNINQHEHIHQNTHQHNNQCNHQHNHQHNHQCNQLNFYPHNFIH